MHAHPPAPGAQCGPGVSRWRGPDRDDAVGQCIAVTWAVSTCVPARRLFRTPVARPAPTCCPREVAHELLMRHDVDEEVAANVVCCVGTAMPWRVTEMHTLAWRDRGAGEWSEGEDEPLGHQQGGTDLVHTHTRADSHTSMPAPFETLLNRTGLDWKPHGSHHHHHQLWLCAASPSPTHGLTIKDTKEPYRLPEPAVPLELLHRRLGASGRKVRRARAFETPT